MSARRRREQKIRYDFYGYTDEEALGSRWKNYGRMHFSSTSHVELCPVCNGSGKFKEYLTSNFTGTTCSYIERTCHGCNGKGWVVVATTYSVR